MLEINNTNWNYPTPIWFGLNRTAEIKLALTELSISKPLIVTDPQFSENENFEIHGVESLDGANDKDMTFLNSIKYNIISSNFAAKIFFWIDFENLEMSKVLFANPLINASYLNE